MNTEVICLSPHLIAASLAAGLLGGLTGSDLYADVVTNNVVSTNSSTVATNASAGYAGAASALWGFGPGGILSDGTTASVSLAGDAQEAADLELNLAGGLAGEVPHATVIGQQGVTASEASVADVNVTGCRSFFTSGTTTIAADFVMSQARAVCSSDGPTFSGATQISGRAGRGRPTRHRDRRVEPVRPPLGRWVPDHQ
jgi:hypothetical protein